MTQTIKDKRDGLKPGDKIWVLAEVNEVVHKNDDDQPVHVSFVGDHVDDYEVGYWLSNTQVVKGFDNAND